jgi:hypothetical protein
MATGNSNLDEKLRATPERPTPADKLRGQVTAQAEALKSPPETDGFDPREVLPAVTSALNSLGMLYPGAGRTSVAFQFVPSETDYDETTWVVQAKLSVYGNLETNVDPENPEADASMEERLLSEVTIAGAEKPSLGLATKDLQVRIQSAVNEEAATRATQAETLRGALARMEAEADLKGVWADSLAKSEDPEPEEREEPDPEPEGPSAETIPVDVLAFIQDLANPLDAKGAELQGFLRTRLNPSTRGGLPWTSSDIENLGKWDALQDETREMILRVVCPEG